MVVTRPVASEGALATAAVEIIAELERFEPELRDKLIAAVQKAADAAEREFKRRGDRGGKAFADAVNKAAAKAPSFDAMTAQIERLEKAAVKAGNAQADAAGKVRVAEAELAKVKQKSANDSARIIAAEQKLAKARRDAAHADNLAQEATQALSAARSKLAAEGEKLGEAAGGGIGNGIRRGARKGADDAGGESGNIFSRAFQRAAERALGTGMLRTFGVAAAGLATAVSPLSTVLGGGAAAVVALAGALSQAAGAGLALGGVLGSVGLAAAALMVGTAGLDDAWKAQTKALAELDAEGKVSEATQKKLDAAMKNLAPSARATVKELAAMAPAWAAVRKSVQGDLFAGMAHSLQQLGNTFFPILTKQLGTAAGTLNLFGRGLVDFITRGNRANQVNTIFTGLNGILRTLLQTVGPVAGGFLDLFTASLPFAQQLATVIRSLGTDFGLWLGKVADGAGFQKFMQDAMTLAGNLFQLLGNIGSIIASVFGAGAAAGGGLLTVLRDLTASAAAFLKSAEGQQALASFFGLISQAGQVLVGVFSTLSPLLGGLSALFSALQPALRAVGAALAPVIQALSLQLGSTLAQLGQDLAGLISTGIAPLAAALGTFLVGAVKALTPILSGLLSGLTALAPGLTVIAQVLGTFLVQALQLVGPLFQSLLVTLGQLLGTYLVAIAPQLRVIFAAVLQLVAPLVQMGQAFLTILQSLLPVLPALGQLNVVLLQTVLAFLPLVTTILQHFADLMVQMAPTIAQIVPPLIQVIAFLTDFSLMVLQVVTNTVAFGVRIVQVFLRISDAARSMVVTVVGFFVGLAVQAISAAVRLGSGVVSAIASMASRVTGFFVSLVTSVAGALGRFAAAVKSGVDKAIAFFRGLPGQIQAAVGNLGSLLVSAGSAAVQGFINGLEGGLKKVRDIAGQIASAVTGPVRKFLDMHSPSRVMHGLGGDTVQGYIDGVREKTPALRAALTALASAVPDQVKAAVGKVSAALGSLGKALTSTQRTRLNTLIASAQTGLAVLARSQDALDKKMKTASDNLKAQMQQAQQFASQIASNILQSGNITQGQDQSFAGIVKRLTDAKNAAQQFQTVLARLSASGLNKTALQQIAEAGPDAGLRTGQAILAAGKTGIATINKLQGQLQTAANQAANTAANALFGQGIKVAQGIVAGLARQQKQLDAQMTRLGDVLVARILRVLRTTRVGNIDIPGYADGGLVSSPTLARLGEGGAPEVVIPLTKPKRRDELLERYFSGWENQRAWAGGGGYGGKVREINMPLHVHGLSAGEVGDVVDRRMERYGVPRRGIDTAGGKR